MEKVVINAGGGGLDIPDVDGFIAECTERGEVPYVDLGGGMQVRLAELVEDAEAADGPLTGRTYHD